MVMCLSLFTSDPELLFGAASEQRSLSDWHIPFVAQPGSALSGLSPAHFTFQRRDSA